MLERPTGGQILLDGEDITAKKYNLTLTRRKMGMVFQSFHLFGHLTVIEILIEHAAQENATSVTVLYGGPQFDPHDTENELSLRVLQSAAQEIRCRYDPSQPLPNKVLIRIKNA